MKKDNIQPSSSYRTETLGPKRFRVLVAPSVTPVKTEPLQVPATSGDPVFLFLDEPDAKAACRKTDAPWKGASDSRVPAPKTSARPFTESLYSTALENIDAAKLAAIEADAQRIRRRKSPRAPRESDPVGYVPSELRFTRYVFNKRPTIHTESQWRHEFYTNDESHRAETPRTTLTDLESCSDGNSIDDVLYYDDYTLPEPEQARSRAGYIKPSDRQLLKIQKLRDKGMTQKQIAKRLRMTPRQVQLLCDKIKERVSPLMLKSATAQASAAYDSQTLNSRKGEGLA